MKIAITSAGKESASTMDARFGRTPWFMVTDPETGLWEAYANEQNMNAAQGAGIQSAQRLINLGVEAVITGHVGPKAFRILKAADIGIFHCEGGTVDEALQLFKQGRLIRTDQADVEGHWT